MFSDLAFLSSGTGWCGGGGGWGEGEGGWVYVPHWALCYLLFLWESTHGQVFRGWTYPCFHKCSPFNYISVCIPPYNVTSPKIRSVCQNRRLVMFLGLDWYLLPQNPASSNFSVWIPPPQLTSHKTTFRSPWPTFEKNQILVKCSIYASCSWVCRHLVVVSLQKTILCPLSVEPHLTLTMLWANSADDVLKYFSYFSNGDNFHT